MEELISKLSDPSAWDDPKTAQELNKQKVNLEKELDKFFKLEESISDSIELAEIAIEEDDNAALEGIANEISEHEVLLHELEFIRMFSNKMDPNNAFLDIQSGSGGTEAQDWAEMIMRMYLKWGEAKNFKTEVVEVSHGEVAGIKSATIRFEGSYAYGWLRTETGVHRLVRLSPFDSDHARHTSFALVEVLPESEGNAEIVINNDDIRVDVFKASGHGGQSVQKNSTAIRITHLPTNIVVTCQNERSQFQNKEHAMKVLRARLMDLQLKNIAEEQAKLKGEHVSAEWGNQIRSYVLHPYRMVKDHRTGYETSNTDEVLDGNIDQFLKSYLIANIK